jgi:hypothetical protein
MPNDATPNNIIALMWDDMDPGDNSDPAYYQAFAAGACPWDSYAGACFVVEYEGYSHYLSSGAIDNSAGTWEAILLDDGTVILQYLDVGAEAGSGAAIGIEGADAAADHGVQYACQTASSLTNDLCIEYSMSPMIGLAPAQDDFAGCVDTPQVRTFTLANLSGAPGTFALTYNVTSVNGTLTGPADVTVADTASQSFDVTLTPGAGVGAGDQVVATIDANGNSLSATSNLSETIAAFTTWEDFTGTPAGSRFHAVAYHNGSLYQIGGETDWWTATAAVNVYDVAGGTWSAGNPLPTPVYGIDAAVIGDDIYVVGGTDCSADPTPGCDAADGSYYDTVQTLDTTTGAWSTDATDPLPVALAQLSLVSSDGKLYAIGGMVNGTPGTPTAANTLYIYDPTAADGSRWSTGAPMATARAYASAGAIDGKIYVAGGYDGTVTTYSMEVYDIAGGTWSAGTSMPAVPDPDGGDLPGLAPFGDGTLGGRYLMAYGTTDLSWTLADGTTYSCGTVGGAYDTVGDTWIILSELPRCLYGIQGDSDGTTLYTVSGRTNEGGWQMTPLNQSLIACSAGPADLIFENGFESGTMSGWSTTAP